MQTIIKTHGRGLRWTIAELRRAGIPVNRVEKALGRYFFVTVEADADQVDAALATMRGYKPRKPSKPIALRLADGLLVVGLVSALLVGLVAPIGAPVMLATLGIVRFAFGKMHEAASDLFDLGGKWRLYGILGVTGTLIMLAGFIVVVGGMATTEIANGNSALSLLAGE